MKIIWALLNAFAIFILATGLWLWWQKRHVAVRLTENPLYKLDAV